jgi:mRNA-degrading endonuclease RelE of RelBE toxin-antitoxin system
MANFGIEMTEEARTDLSSYIAFERKLIVSEIRRQLENRPNVETRNCKPLRENPIASWELRVGKHRIFYEVDETTRTVSVVSVGHKEHNVLWVRGKEVQL